VPSKTLTGSAVVNYEERLIAIHAVALEDGVPATRTVCGTRRGGEVERAFDQTLIVTRCSVCAEAIGESHLGR
jgi:hypothetical protein